MRDEQISTESWANAIAVLEAKRDEMDRIIRKMKAMAQLETPTMVAVAPVNPEKTPPIEKRPYAVAPLRPHYSAGLGDECVRILKNHPGAALSTRQVTDLLLGSGFELKTANPVQNVFSSLNHRVKVTGDVERVGSNWRYARRQEKAEASQLASQLNGAAYQPKS